MAALTDKSPPVTVTPSSVVHGIGTERAAGFALPDGGADPTPLIVTWVGVWTELTGSTGAASPSPTAPAKR